jgi:transcriptional regulator NrdR family protein
MERPEPEPGERPLREIVRRDGARERFDAARLAASIHRAALAVGQGELLLAEELAALVALVLASDHDGAAPSTRSLRETVERMLMETGHHDVARSYILQQARDGEAAASRSPAAAKGASIRVASLGRECLEPFDAARIVESLVLDVGLRSADARKIATAVERQVRELGASVVAGATVRQLIARALLDGGRAELLPRVQGLGIPSQEVEAVAFARSAGERPEVRLGEELMRRYSLARLLDPATAEAHLSGELHVDGLSAPGRALQATIDFGEVRRASLPGALAALLHLVHGIEPALHGTLTLAHVERALAPAFGSVAQAEEAARALLLALCDGAAGRSSRPVRRILGVGVDLPDRIAASRFRRGAAPDTVRERLLAFVNHLLEQAANFAAHLHLPRLRLLIDHGEEERELLAVSAGLQPALALGVAEVAHAAPGPAVRVVGARVALNVARLGLSAGRRRETELLRALPALVERGVAASTNVLRDLLQRDEAGVGFLRRLRDVTRDIGGDLPLELSGSHAYAVVLVPVGVDAAVRAVTERDPAESEAAARLRDDVLAALTAAVPERGGARFELNDEPFSEAELRFGRRDFLAFPRGHDVLGLAHDGAAFRYASDPVPRSGPFATTVESSANSVRASRPSEGTVSA